MLVDQNIILADSPAIGSFSAGWLRRIDTTWQQFASIEIDGWYVRAYGADNFSDAEGTIYAKDLDQSEVLFNRKNGVATISFPLQDGRTMLKNGVVIQGLISLNNRWQKTASRKITYCL
jgi:hypothetical protein